MFLDPTPALPLLGRTIALSANGLEGFWTKSPVIPLLDKRAQRFSHRTSAFRC
jgi:hypothetical protein